MSLTVYQVIRAHQTYSAFSEQEKERKFPVPFKVRLLIAEQVLKTRPVFTEYQKENERLVLKYGDPLKDKPDHIAVTDPAKNIEYLKECQAALAVKTKIRLEKIAISDFGEPDISVDLLTDLKEQKLLG